MACRAALHYRMQLRGREDARFTYSQSARGPIDLWEFTAIHSSDHSSHTPSSHPGPRLPPDMSASVLSGVVLGRNGRQRST
jgi:hypothetical protein